MASSPPHGLDIGVLIYASIVVVFLVASSCMLCYHRKARPLHTRNPLLMSAMAFGGSMHIVAEMITNQHAVELSWVEQLSCVFFGYWMPYALGAGVFFTALYLRLFTYTAGVSVWCASHESVSRARRSRVLIVLVTLAPIITVAILATVTEDATHIDSTTGQCRSAIVFKGLVAVWIVICILALMVSVVVFRRGFARDIIGEARKQCLVSIMGTVVAGAEAFVLVFAETGLDDPVNRALATFSAATLYLWSLGVLAARPLSRAACGDTEKYDPLMSKQLGTMEQPLTSVRYVLENGLDSAGAGTARTLFADFMMYCATNKNPMALQGSDHVIFSQPAATCYSCMDYWTQRKLHEEQDRDDDDDSGETQEDADDGEGVSSNSGGARDSGDDGDGDGDSRPGTPGRNGFPPLVSQDVVRSDENIIALYFHDLPQEDIGLNPEQRADVLADIRSRRDSSKFKRAMWAVVDLLDKVYASEYLNRAIYGRDIYSETIASFLIGIRRSKAREHLLSADLIYDGDDPEWPATDLPKWTPMQISLDDEDRWVPMETIEDV